MKLIFAMPFVLLGVLSIQSKDFFQVKSYQFLSLEDSLPAYNPSVLKTIGDKLDMETTFDLPCNIKIKCANKKNQLGFSYFEKAFNPNFFRSDIIKELHLNIYQDTCDISIFNTWLHSNRKANRNFYRFLTSAYEQEVNPNIKNNDSLYFDLKEKSAKELSRRTWLLPVTGISYMRDGNPFSRMNNFWLCLEVIEEAGYLSAIILPPFLSKRKEEKISLPLLGIAGLIEFRWLANIDLHKDLKRYEAIRKSGYRIPRTVECPDCTKDTISNK